VKIRFENFWTGFRPESSLLGEWCAAAFGSYRTVTKRSVPVDIAITSVMAFPTKAKRAAALSGSFFSRGRRLAYREAMEYGIPLKSGPARRRVWYTGENIRPPEGFDLTLSFDLDDYGGTNLYAPFWLDRVSVNGASASERVAIPAEVLTSDRIIERVPPRFCAAVMSNPHPMRLRAIEALRSIGRVDVYGRAYGRPLADKAAVLSEYRFNLAFENDLYPGYVTEKVIDAWSAGCVPLWWGIDPAGYVDPQSVVNLAECGSLRTFLDVVAALDADNDGWRAMAEHKLMMRRFDHEEVIRAIRSLAES